MPERKVVFDKSYNGFLGKSVRYIGKEAHAGSAPEKGINALNAALLGLMGIHAQRETFKEEDTIRIHPIITKGGDMVNNVPADVRIETYVRGKTIEAIMDANKKVNRALRAGAMAVGAEVEITEIPGYMPCINDPPLVDLMRNNAAALIGKENIVEGEHRTGSTDVGDLSCIMSTAGVSVGGVIGNGHSRDLKIIDPYTTYVLPAKIIAMTIIDLLSNNATKAKEIISIFKPRIPRGKYLEYWDKLLTSS
jgi:metal-dependent amidase/aminoacylase/carboxypeptidase family protein